MIPSSPITRCSGSSGWGRHLGSGRCARARLPSGRDGGADDAERRGLQHEDGHSQVLASTVPNCVAYDPAYAYEIAVIVRDGLRRMYDENEDVFYYLTLGNENYPQPPLPQEEGTIEGILKGIYRVSRSEQGPRECNCGAARRC